MNSRNPNQNHPQSFYEKELTMGNKLQDKSVCKQLIDSLKLPPNNTEYKWDIANWIGLNFEDKFHNEKINFAIEQLEDLKNHVYIKDGNAYYHNKIQELKNQLK